MHYKVESETSKTADISGYMNT